MDAVWLNLVRVTDYHEIGNKLVVLIQIEVHPIGNGGTLFSIKMIVEDAEDVACHAVVVEGGPGRHHDHLAADQLLAPLLLVCQITTHTEYSFLLPSGVHASPGLFFPLNGKVMILQC